MGTMNYVQRREMWDRRFLELAALVSTWSKDRSTRVGCVFVGPNREVLAVGYNGFPRGVDDNIAVRHERPVKYRWTEHAERNAIYNAARHGVRLDDAVAYVPWYPCMDCARALIQVGVRELVCGSHPDVFNPNWGPDFALAVEMLEEAGVEVRVVEGPWTVPAIRSPDSTE